MSAPQTLVHIPLEERLSRAAFTVNRLCSHHRMVGLRLGDGRSIPPASGTAHRLRLLRELALYR